MQLALDRDGSILVELRAKPMFLQRIQKLHNRDINLEAKQRLVESGQTSEFNVSDDRSL